MVKTNAIGHLASSNSPALPLKDIKPIRGPVSIPNVWLWVWCIAAVLLLAALAWWLWRKRRQQKAVLPPEVVIPPHEKALARLRELLAWINQPETFCLLVSDAIRVYLEERFRLHAADRTTEELLEELQPRSILTHNQKQSVGQFLMACDLVKFARHHPGEDDLRGLYNAAVQLVEETQQPAGWPVEAASPVAQTQ